MTHHLEKHFCLLFHQAATTSPSYRTLDKPHALHPELQRYKDTVWCGVLCAKVPRHQQEQLLQILFVRLLKCFQNSLGWAPSLSTSLVSMATFCSAPNILRLSFSYFWWEVIFSTKKPPNYDQEKGFFISHWAQKWSLQS